MPNDDRPLVEDFTNADWMNAVRNDAGLDYQSRIPEVTQANIQDVVQTLWTYKPYLNKFVDTLVNRIGLVIFTEWSWHNPLAPLKRGMLAMGETIEEIMVGLVEADEYDADRDELEKELFGAKKPEVSTSYHTVNRRNRYKLTIREPELVNAFITANGLSTFVAQLLGAAQKSDQIDEFVAMANLFKEMDQAATSPDGGGGLFNVNIADIGDQDSTPEQSKYALRRMREFGVTLQFPSRRYNLAGMPQAIKPDDLIMFTTPEADAAMDVEALAAAFNIEKADVGYRKFVLPAEYYGIPGFQAALTTKEFFVVADQRIETTSMHNPASLLTNYWLHHWQVISASLYAPLVMLNSQRPSTTIPVTEYAVTSITPFVITDDEGVTAATNVERGEIYNVAVEAVTTPVGGPGVSVRLSLEGKTSAFTRITNGGAMYIAPDEGATTLTIRATAVDSDNVPQLSSTTTRAVVGTQIIVWPHPSINEDTDNDGQFEVTPLAPVEDPDNVVTIPEGVEGAQYRKTVKEAVTFTASGNLVGVPKHGAKAGDTVVFGAITTTTGITAGTAYFVRSAGLTEDAFTIATTSGGAAITLTGNGSAASARFNVEQGSVHNIAGATDIDAVAITGWELASGAVALWPFDN